MVQAAWLIYHLTSSHLCQQSLFDEQTIAQFNMLISDSDIDSREMCGKHGPVRATHATTLPLLIKTRDTTGNHVQPNITYGGAYWICMPSLSREVSGDVAMRRHLVHLVKDNEAEKWRNQRRMNGAGGGERTADCARLTK